MPMPIGTINDTTWAEASPATGNLSLRVRPFLMARPLQVVLGAELALLCLALLHTAWKGATFEAPIIIACCTLSLYLKAMDVSIVGSSKTRFWSDLREALLWGSGAALLLLLIFPALGTRTVAVLVGFFATSLLPTVLRPILRHLTTHRRLAESMLIVGNGRLAEKLHQALSTSAGFAEQQRTRRLVRFPGSLADCGLTGFSDLPEYLQSEGISRIIVAEQSVPNRSRLAATLVGPRLGGLVVSDAVDFYEQFFEKIWIDGLSSEWFVYTGGFKMSRIRTFFKRSFDILFATVLLVLAAPFLLLVALAIKLESAGPVLFRQTRVGLDGKTFVIYKLRSMRQDAEGDLGPAWAKEIDDRVTRLGRLLRKLHIDEIPQAFNVLRGEMSLVGPRPERPFFVDRLTREIPFYNLRHCVKPGVTGLAQVKYQYGASVEDAIEKLQYDLYYAKHGSCLFDIGILLRTLELVVFGRGKS